MLPLSTDLSSSVTVCAVPSWFVHVIVSPTLAWIVAGLYRKSLIATAAAPAAGAEAAVDALAATDGALELPFEQPAIVMSPASTRAGAESRRICQTSEVRAKP